MKTIKVVSAAWCPTCGPYKAALKHIGLEYENVDADEAENVQMLNELGIRSLPTTLVYEGNELVAAITGNKVKELLEVLE